MNYLSKQELTNKISALLAGRTAEQIIFNDVTSGASNDLEVATNIATLMVTKYGMGDTLGPIALSDQEISTLIRDFHDPINEEIRNIIINCQNKTEKILKENIKLLHKVAKFLMEKGTISGEEFIKIIGMK